MPRAPIQRNSPKSNFVPYRVQRPARTPPPTHKYLFPVEPASPTRKTLESNRHDNRDFDERDDSALQDWNHDEPTFVWPDEQTLVSDLIGEPVSRKEDVDAQVTELYEQLQHHFTLEGKNVAHDIARTLCPTVSKIKKSFSVMHKRFDQPFGTAVIAFNDTCKNVEQFRAEEEEAIKDVHESTQADLERLFEELGKAYHQREVLWKNLDEAVDKIVVSAQEDLKEAPAKVERVISSLEKHSRNFKDDGADTIRSILEKLG